MGLPFVLDVAIGLIFIFLILSLIASEIQELITTLLQWRAKHLKQSIEVLLAGGSETPEEAKVKALADRIYDDPLLRNVNQEAKGYWAKQLRSWTQIVIGSGQKIFGTNHTTGPSYIQAETFATSLLERLGIPILARKLSEVRLRKFADRIVGHLTYDNNENLRVLKSNFLKDNWQKGHIRVMSENLKRPDLIDGDAEVPDEKNENFQLFLEMTLEYDDVLRDFEAGQSTLETSVERMGDSLKGYIDNLKLKYNLPIVAGSTPSKPPAPATNETASGLPLEGMNLPNSDPEGEHSSSGSSDLESESEASNNGKTVPEAAPIDEAAVRFIRRLESFRLGLFGIKNERAILSGGLKPSVFEIAQLINQTSNVYREVADAYKQLTTQAKPIEDKVNPEIQRRLLEDQLELVEAQLEQDYFEVLEKQLTEDVVESFKSKLIQQGYLNQDVIESQLKPEEYRSLLDRQLQDYVLAENLPSPDIGLADISDRAQAQAIIRNVLNELSKVQSQRVVNAALSLVPAPQRESEIVQPAIAKLSLDQRLLLACQPITNQLLDKFEVPQRLYVIRIAWKTLAPEQQQRILEAIWNNLSVDQRQELAETLLDTLTERQRQRISRSIWAVMNVETNWDKFSSEVRQNLLETALSNLPLDQRQRLAQTESRQLEATQRQTIVQLAQQVRQVLENAFFGEEITAESLVPEQHQKLLQRQRLVSSIFSELEAQQRYAIALELAIHGFRKLLTPEDQQLANWEKLGARQLIINSVWAPAIAPLPDPKISAPTAVQPETPLPAPQETIGSEPADLPIAPDPSLNAPPLPPTSDPASFEPASFDPASSEPASFDPASSDPVDSATSADKVSSSDSPIAEPAPLMGAESEAALRYPLLSREDQALILNEFWDGLATNPTPSPVLQRLDKGFVSAGLGRLDSDLGYRIVGAGWPDLPADLRQTIAENARPNPGDQTRIARTDTWQNFSQEDRQAILNAIGVEIGREQRLQVVEAAWKTFSAQERQKIFEAAWQTLKIPQRQRILSPVLQTFKDEQRRLILNLAWDNLNPLQQQLILSTYLQRLGEAQRQLVITHVLEQLANLDRHILIERSLEQAQLTDSERRIYDNAQTYKEIQQVLDKLPQSVKDSLESLARRSQSRASQVGNELNLFRDEIGVWFDRSMSRASGVYKRNAKGVAIALGFLIAVMTNADALYMVNRLSSDEELRQVITNEATKLTTAQTALPTPTDSPTDLPTDSPIVSPTVSPTAASDVRDRLSSLKKQTDSVLQDLSLPVGWNFTNLRQQLRCSNPTTQTTISDTDWHIFVKECLQETPRPTDVFDLTKFGTALWLHMRELLMIPIGWMISGLAIAMGAPFWFDLLSKIVNVRNSGSRPTSSSPTANPGAGEASPKQP